MVALDVYAKDRQKKSGQRLQAGDKALTDIDGRINKVVILERKEGTRSQSGIMFRVKGVHSPLRGHGENAWIDADWFVAEL